MSYTQDHRPIGIETPLGKDHLLLTAITGEEAVSRFFRFELEMLSEDMAIQPEDIVGKRVTVRIRRADGSDRWINGHVSRFWAGWVTEQGLRVYGAEMVPWLWFLGETADCRVIQNKSVPQIAGQIFREFGFEDVDLSGLDEEHPVRTSLIQYQESHYAYLCRLMESEGIFYVFRHEKGRHTLVLGDTNRVFLNNPETDLVYDAASGAAGRITAWNHNFRFHAGRWSTSDYNYKEPSLPLRSDRKMLAPVQGMEKFEVYEWPGGYFNRKDGDALVRHRMEEREAAFHTVEGAGTCAAFTAGTRFRLANHPDPKVGKLDYALLSVRHEARDESYLTGDEGAYHYSNRFVAFPTVSPVSGREVQYRPPRVTPKPVIHGTQTAVVVGPPGEEIHCDEFARVKVQFHWDRHAPGDHTSSPWVRVSQAWAGKGYGTLHLPHVGQEVIVSFSDGDPDRPLIVGRVYNASEKNPLVAEALEYKTKSITKDQGGNIIATEGKAGGQQILLQSPTANTTIQIGAVDAVRPSAGAAQVVPDGFVISTAGEYAADIGQNFNLSVTGSSTQTVGGNEWKVTVGDSNSYTKGNTSKITIGNSQSYTEGNDAKVTKGNSSSFTKGCTSKWAYSADFAFSIAASYSFFLGAKASTNIAATIDTKLGADMKIGLAFGLSFDLAKYEIGIVTSKSAISKKEFNLNKTEVAAAKQKTAAAEAEAIASKSASVAMESRVSALENSTVALKKSSDNVRFDINELYCIAACLYLNG